MATFFVPNDPPWQALDKLQSERGSFVTSLASYPTEHRQGYLQTGAIIGFATWRRQHVTTWPSETPQDRPRQPRLRSCVQVDAPYSHRAVLLSIGVYQVMSLPILHPTSCLQQGQRHGHVAFKRAILAQALM
ncbi:unnamed protein product [Ixodes pacificus]